MIYKRKKEKIYRRLNYYYYYVILVLLKLKLQQQETNKNLYPSSTNLKG